jgi:hypothetical protein
VRVIDPAFLSSLDGAMPTLIAWPRARAHANCMEDGLHAREVGDRSSREQP